MFSFVIIKVTHACQSDFGRGGRACLGPAASAVALGDTGVFPPAFISCPCVCDACLTSQSRAHAIWKIWFLGLNNLKSCYR